MSTERRQQPRKVPKDFTYIRVGEDSGGKVLNLSEHGLCFEALSPIHYTESFQFWLSFNLIDRIDGAGTIVWVDTAKRIAGIRFMEMSQYSRQQIRAWMKDVLVTEGAVEGEGTEGVELPFTSRTHEVEKHSSVPATVEQSEEVNLTPTSRDSESEVRWNDSSVSARVAHAMAGEAAIPEEPARMESEEMSPMTEMDPGSQWSRVTELVPLSRHLTTSRMQFVRGILVGALVCGVIILPLYWLLGPRQKGGASVDVPGTTTTVSAGTLTVPQAATPVADVVKPMLVVPTGSNFERTSRPVQSHSSSGWLGVGAQKGRNVVVPSAGQEPDPAAEPPSSSPSDTPSATVGGNALSAEDVARSIGQAGAGDRSVSLLRSGGSFTTSVVQPGGATAGELPAFHRANPISQPPVGGDVRPPRLIASRAPVYPALARKQRVGGDVEVDAIVETNGRIGAAKALSGPVLLQGAAIEAVKQWRYQPGTLDGKAIPMHVTVVLRFETPAQ